VTSLRAGQFGVRIFAGREDFSFLQNVKNGFTPQTEDYSVGTGVLSRGWIGWSVKLTTHLHPVLRLYVIITVPLLLQYAFMAWRRAPSLEAFFVSHTNWCVFHVRHGLPIMRPRQRFGTTECHLHTFNCQCTSALILTGFMIESIKCSICYTHKFLMLLFHACWVHSSINVNTSPNKCWYRILKVGHGHLFLHNLQIIIHHHAYVTFKNCYQNLWANRLIWYILFLYESLSNLIALPVWFGLRQSVRL